jgi:FkbM family methyltransferase
MNLEEHARWIADNGEAKRYEYKLAESSFVIDLGGYKGEWTAEIHRRYGSNILIFEPVKSFFDGIEKRFEDNEMINAANVAIGNERRTEIIHLNQDATSMFVEGEVEEIKILDVYETFKINEIESVDLMKINIEGGEYELLERMIETNMLGIVDNYQIQFHDFIPNCTQRRNAIREELKKTHKCDWCYEFVWESWSKI